MCIIISCLWALRIPSPKTSDKTDPSGCYCVLVAGIVIISTMGDAILREGTASMNADGIDVGVSVISWRWDLAMFVCSEYFLSAEIGSYEKNYPVNLNFNPGWTP